MLPVCGEFIENDATERRSTATAPCFAAALAP
jgi:hypothetical protein